MSDGESREVGVHGQIQLPERVRNAIGIRNGDEVVVRKTGCRIVIKQQEPNQHLEDGYRERTASATELAQSFRGVSSEADDCLGDKPDW
jgi:AbrB family looped-hinge helix DNA binding protein